MAHNIAAGKQRHYPILSSPDGDVSKSSPDTRDRTHIGPPPPLSAEHVLPGSELRPRLLVVDDDLTVSTALTCSLSLIGYNADAVPSGREALQMMAATPYDLVVLELHVPDLDGVELMRRIRRHWPDLDMIVLTGRPTLESAIAAVRSQVTDYLVKPISIHEIAAVVSHAIERRGRSRGVASDEEVMVDAIGRALDGLNFAQTPDRPAPVPAQEQAPAQQSLRVGSLRLDLEKRTVTIPDQATASVELTEGEAAVLAALIAARGEVLSCRQLAQAATGCDVERWEAESVVRPHIHRLRRKIDGDPAGPNLIRTVRGRGYYFSVAVA